MTRGCAPPTDPFAVRVGRLFPLAFLAIVSAPCCAPPPAAAASPAPLDSRIAQLDAIRRQDANVALAVQQRERAIGALDLAIGAMQGGVDAKSREIAES